LGISQKYTILAVWAIAFLIYIVLEPHKILSIGTFQTIFGGQLALVFLGLAALCTLMVGDFDLSIASILGLGATVVAVLNGLHGVNVVVASVIAVVACGLVGAVNGIFVVFVRVNGLIVTLGTSTLLLGVALQLSQSQTISGLSRKFSGFALHNVLGLPLGFYYGIGVAAVFAYIEFFTPLGRNMTFIGANREVARLAGVRVDRIRFIAYIASGLLAGTGGVLLAAQLGGFDASASPGYLLPALSAVFLGTAVIRPGQFNPIGTLVGVYFLATGIIGLELLGLGGWIEDVFYGAALVLAVSISTLVRRFGGNT
jgi:ribose transport system permease protein